MYAPPSDDDRPSGRHHSLKGVSRGRSGTDASKKGEKGSALRRKSSAASTRRPVLGRKKSPPSWGIKKDLSLVDRIAAFFVENQIRFSATILAAMHGCHYLSPQLRPTTRKLLEVCYYNPATGNYGKGPDDVYLVFYWIVMFTFLRATAVDYIFMPFARCGGISAKKDLVRFAEQAWLLVYYSVFWTLGMYLMYNSPYWMDLAQMWVDWPVRELGGTFKWYYLVQYAFWLQQIFVLNIEERRKDYHQMFAHHIVTCMLIFASYTYHMTRVGNVILCVMDVVDILLPLAKMLKYLGYNAICDCAFGVFLITWFVGRHVCYMRIVHSSWVDALTHIREGWYAPNATEPILYSEKPRPSTSFLLGQFLKPMGTVVFTKEILGTFVILLLALQVLTLMWFYMILRVAWKVIKGGGADDTRSDDEDDDEEEEEEDIEFEGSNPKAVETVQMNGTSMSTASFPSVIMNGGSHRHLSSQPLGGG
ncbi:unnamed protein product [Tuber aestivum]|uniref:TLC domain-containing protein n=1 Tax=Tuber aestivum TaxID=59557 RepID=A0A292PLA0_9PEZI|nr:unnamed protein product [Tuber aestivum]